MLVMHVAASLFVIRRQICRGASWLGAGLTGLLGFLLVPLIALFVTGLLGDFAANWIDDIRTIQSASVFVFPLTVILMWSYQFAYWHYTRNLSA